jgi:hypothetical protein
MSRLPMVAALLASPVLFACSWQSTTAPVACEVLSGTFELRWDIVSGDCDPFTQGTVSSSEPPCPGMVEAVDQCSERYTLTCELPDGRRGDMRGDTHWAQDGRSATGLLTYDVWQRDGQRECSAVYRTHLEKM